MTRRKREHAEARAELREAATWYDDEQSGLGEDFLDAIDAAVRDILDWPNVAPVVPGWDGTPVVRSKGVRVFPYRVMYYVTDATIVVLAYAHQRRRPTYWKHRLGG